MTPNQSSTTATERPSTYTQQQRGKPHQQEEIYRKNDQGKEVT